MNEQSFVAPLSRWTSEKEGYSYEIKIYVQYENLNMRT